MLQYLRKTYNRSQAAFYEKTDKALENSEKMFIVTANPEIFMTARNVPDFHRVLTDKSVTIIPDGIGVVKAMEQIGMKTEGRIPGVELSAHLLETASRLKKSVCFFGAKQEVIDALVKKCEKNYPGLNITGAYNGYCDDRKAVFDKICEAKPDIVLVALGVPAQELIIAKNIDRFDKGIFIGVGGTFDVLSGMKQRAPAIFIKLNLEWLYRILKEPSRLKRFWNSNVKFFSEVKKEYNKEKKDEKD